MPDISDDILARMREDWNRRAKEDAFYYVAFGRRQQNHDEFLATAADAVRGLEYDLARLPASIELKDRKALEIGCGPGRLMGFMSRHFGEIHGVDVSDEMIRMAQDHLRDIPHAQVRHNSGTDLALFPDESFHFVYSYAVFQHIPSRDVVLNYLRESARVLKPAGVLCCQLRGRAQTDTPDTWDGCAFSRSDVFDFARAFGLQLQWIYGADTQYMWMTARKPTSAGTLKAVTAAGDGSFIVPNKGQAAGISCWVEGLPEEIGLDDLRIQIQGREATPCYIGPHLGRGGFQINALLPDGLEPGASAVSASCRHIPLSGNASIDVIAAPKPEPKVLEVLDGIHLVSQKVIETRSIKVIMMGVENHDEIHFAIDDMVVRPAEITCYDPLLCLYHYSFDLPAEITDGPHTLNVGREQIAIEVRGKS